MNRLFEIIYILMRKNTVTAQELAERFEVSRRTIYRDIDTLSLAGIPVYTTKGKGGGISLMEDFVLNKSLLSQEEQGEILSALQGLSAVRGGDVKPVLEKLSSLFQQETIPWIEVDFSDWSFQNGGMFELLKTAILQRRVVELDYYSSYGEMLHRRAEPLQLWFKHKTWYIKCFCQNRKQVRLFRLSRIKNLKLTQESFPQRNLLDPPMRDDTKNTHVRPDVTLKLQIAPEMAYRIYDEIGDAQAVQNSDKSYTVTVTWPEDEWVYGFLLSFGAYVKVLEPVHVREKLREKLICCLENYEM